MESGSQIVALEETNTLGHTNSVELQRCCRLFSSCLVFVGASTRVLGIITFINIVGARTAMTFRFQLIDGARCNSTQERKHLDAWVLVLVFLSVRLRNGVAQTVDNFMIGKSRHNFNTRSRDGSPLCNDLQDAAAAVQALSSMEKHIR